MPMSLFPTAHLLICQPTDMVNNVYSKCVELSCSRRAKKAFQIFQQVFSNASLIDTSSTIATVDLNISTLKQR